MTVVAGVDVGNATTEVVLAEDGSPGSLDPRGRDGPPHPLRILGAGRVPTRGRKGSADSLRAAAALVRRVERQAGRTVSEAGIGRGTVTSSDGSIGCPGTCAATYNSGSSVTLTASANLGSLFSGWSGACSGLGTCTVTMNAARSVTATFVGVPLPLPPPPLPPLL